MTGISTTVIENTTYYDGSCSCRLTFGLIGWTSSFSNLLSLGALEQRSVETEGALPVDHTLTIKLVRAYKIKISFSL